MSNKKKKGGWVRTLLVVLCAILAVILIVIACAGAYLNYIMSKIDIRDPVQDATMSSSEAEEHNATDPGLETIDPTSTETIPHVTDLPTFSTEVTEPIEQAAHIINIMLVGEDRRPEEESRARSDAMILVTFNLDANTITLTSFMRDQYVQIPGYAPNKLNAAYQYGGATLMNETLRVNFGVQVDGNVEVDFSEFEQLIDVLGGVNINLTQAEVDFLNMTYHWGMEQGTTKLTGEQALAYSRIRFIDSDYRRAERQRKVILSLVDSYKSKPLGDMVNLLTEEILPLVSTNIQESELISYAWELFPMLSGAQFHTMRIPVDGTFDQGDVQVREGLKNWFQYNIDFEANREALRELFETGKP